MKITDHMLKNRLFDKVSLDFLDSLVQNKRFQSSIEIKNDFIIIRVKNWVFLSKNKREFRNRLSMWLINRDDVFS